MPLAEILDALDYNKFPQYYLKTDEEHSPDIAPLLRSARDAGVDGIYVFQSSSHDKNMLPVQPAVYVAEAQSLEQAREIHCALWNFGKAPFLIVVLPNQIRVYTGFNYSSELQKVGILEDEISLDQSSVITRLADFSANSINTGNLWRKRANSLKSDKRVDKCLLKSLSNLGKYLREQERLEPEVAHALIGKYVYIRYLRDRNILTDQWLQEHKIALNDVLSHRATVDGLRTLIEVLDDHLNGSIFPLDFTHIDLTDEVVSLVASVFKGDQLLPGNLRQLSLDFEVYDFEYIPVEMLSSIYEQFLHIEGKGKKIGAFYTPEYLADYLLAEIHAVKPLTKGMKILDPSCGSGVFLVLAYRRLIEMELAGSSRRKLPLAKLLELLSFLYGVEREQDACYVTEFSLILTLLHYVEADELLVGKQKLPALHNTHIFHYDFFDDTFPLWQQEVKFDWIVGNPPWIQAEDPKDHLAIAWIKSHRVEQPVSSQSVAEAFSWHVIDLLANDGCTGLVLPAASLYSRGSKAYRQYFFQQSEVLRMTNFSNLRGVLFEGKATAPAITLLYRKASPEREKPLIEHYGPFFINQIPNANGDLWTITINENEYQAISSQEAELGESLTWKIALWGTHRDKRAIARLRRLFPSTLGQLLEQNNDWHLNEGLPLRKSSGKHQEEVEALPAIHGKKRLNTIVMNKSEHLFSIPFYALEDIPEDEYFIRRGRIKGLLVSEPPHLVMNASWKYVIYSDEHFIIKPRQIGLSAPQRDAEYLRALSVFFSSSVAKYYLFFQTPSWGIERDRITLEDIQSIPLPHFTTDQVRKLATLQRELVQMEIEHGSAYTQALLDERITSLFEIPKSINTLATEFNRIRSKLIGGGTNGVAVESPSEDDLRVYAQELVEELDSFTNSQAIHHKVIVTMSKELNCCTVEIVRSNHSLPVIVEKGSPQKLDLLAQWRNILNKDLSQWVYIQRGLRIFEGSKVHIYKMPYLINWTRTQALNDADDLIAEILALGINK
ncbi:MAG TPA: N-6 DNA methylase [Candidatus Nitrosopolaris rasttigaisensis]|nr:N-6 DNA methylase [Candidatus Nitrosopolaris rasttigaisensis]